MNCKLFTTIILSFMSLTAISQRHINFNSDWRIGKSRQTVTLPRAWNEDEAFCKHISQHSDSVVWYRKSFTLKKKQISGKKIFIEFEGIRQGGEFFINGHSLGLHENGVMACGFDLTPYVKAGRNLIEVMTDNSWKYHEKSSNSVFQWNSNNFNANYGGIPKNVWLHITPQVYQTLPLFSNLGTTGTYVYASDMDIKAHTATVNLETQVCNDSPYDVSMALRIALPEPLKAGDVNDKPFTLKAGETKTVSLSVPVSNIDWWSWGHGSLYDIRSLLLDENSQVCDSVTITTGFRKTRYAEGKIWLNDRVLMMKGYAQRTSNEWPAVGMSVPAWLSDYSNGLMVKGGANLVRWMHVTPWKQDVESCDRVGLIQAMPAGDAEKDVEGRRWEQRKELMRDAIIYNRNNPSILFYEGGNESISREHMLELKAIRDEYDPHGGRAIGSREMLDINEAEYGGEMLYINKSAKHPMWAMEYCRDEGLRINWDDWSYPYHKEGTGPLYKNQPSEAWHHNQDQLAIEWVRRWYDYWRERPGTGTRVSSGGVKIIFSDTNTHQRGSVNYRTSGATDAMRIPKDGYFAHQVMWHGWVENDDEWQTYIIGHWNYDDESEYAQSLTYNGREDFCKPVYVVSNSDSVALFLNGRKLDIVPKREYHFLFTFPLVQWESGRLEAVSYDLQGHEQSRHAIETAGTPRTLALRAITKDNYLSLLQQSSTTPNSSAFYSSSKTQTPHLELCSTYDMALLEFEVLDSKGRRCPLDNRMVSFTVDGPADWRGGIATGRDDNYILSKELPVECGINRALIRTTGKTGAIRITAHAEGLPDTTIVLQSVQSSSLLTPHSSFLTPHSQFLTPSYTESRTSVPVISTSPHAPEAYDDNELSEWKGGRSVTFTLAEPSAIEDVCIKLSGWRNNRYPIEVLADTTIVWSGLTPTSLGYVHLEIAHPLKAQTYTVRLANTPSSSADGQLPVTSVVPTELAGGKANELDQTAPGPKTLRIVEVEFIVDVAP